MHHKPIDRSGTDEFQVTVQDLDIPFGNGLIVSAELTVTVEHEAYDLGDRITPPGGGGSSVTDFRVKSVEITSEFGTSESSDLIVCNKVTTYLENIYWMSNQDEWATEVWNERAGAEYEAAENAYWDSRHDRERGEL